MTITIIIPTINAKPEWLSRALGSCSFADEILITKELGISKAVNNAVDLARCEWIGVMPDDDFYLPEIFKIVEKMVRSDADIIKFPCRQMLEETFLDGIYDTEEKTIYGSCFMRRKAFLDLGGYRGEIFQDQEIYNRARAEGFKVEYIPIAGGVFRWNKRSKQQRGANRC